MTTPSPRAQEAIYEAEQRILRYFIDDHQGAAFVHNLNLVRGWLLALAVEVERDAIERCALAVYRKCAPDEKPPTCCDGCAYGYRAALRVRALLPEDEGEKKS